MSDEEIPQIVQRFVRKNIASVEAIEVLLLLRADPQRVWTPLQVSKELYSQPEAAAIRLDDLARRRLLLATEDGYRYHPATRELADAVQALADTYARRRVRLISFVFSRPDSVGRSIADAFRLRQDGD